MNKEEAKDELIKVLYSQVVDLSMMSKIELGDDVIAEIKRLKEIINFRNNIDKLIEQGAELARKHEELRDEILNNPDTPQELKDIIIENRIPDDKIVDLTGGKRIKYINPDTFEIEYE